MNPNHLELLNFARLPGKLLGEQAAVLIGCQPHDIPVLVAAGLLAPLGNPSLTCVKYFSAPDIVAKSSDHKWLHKASSKSATT
jgi:hypothetical protein